MCSSDLNKKEMEKLLKMRRVKLTEPLTEKSRPVNFEDIIGQEEGVKALKAAICGPNPQHVIIYGPPGIGKTAAARLVLEEAKKREKSPFKKDSKFVEIDATTIRFDERGIGDLYLYMLCYDWNCSCEWNCGILYFAKWKDRLDLWRNNLWYGSVRSSLAVRSLHQYEAKRSFRQLW